MCRAFGRSWTAHVMRRLMVLGYAKPLGPVDRTNCQPLAGSKVFKLHVAPPPVTVDLLYSKAYGYSTTNATAPIRH